jgi:hypothetical protein
MTSWLDPHQFARWNGNVESGQNWNGANWLFFPPFPRYSALTRHLLGTRGSHHPTASPPYVGHSISPSPSRPRAM